LAALNFLQSITMANESKIIGNGTDSEAIVTNEAMHNDLIYSSRVKPGQHTDDFQQSGQVIEELNQGSGRKLGGKFAPTVRIPAALRYRMYRHTEHSAVVRQWEDLHIVGKAESAADKNSTQNTSSTQTILSSRQFFSRARAYPMAVSSIIPYAPDDEKARLRRQQTEDARNIFKEPQRDWRGISYRSFFKVVLYSDNLVVITCDKYIYHLSMNV
jgi:hypothetical protein